MIAARHLKLLRLERNLTQEYIAFELGVSQKTYSNMECGHSKISLKQLHTLANIYQINVVELITKLFESDPKVIDYIKKSNQDRSEIDVYHGVNHNLPMELLKVYKERIEDLTKIILLKDEQIAALQQRL